MRYPDNCSPDVSRRGTLRALAAGACLGALAACSDQTATSEPGPSLTAPTSRPEATPLELPTSSASDDPQFPLAASIDNGAPAGAGIVQYDLSAERDWSDLDRWYKRKGLTRPEFDGQDRVHRLIGSNRRIDQNQPNLNGLLASAMVLENDVISPPGLFVIAHHNVTTIRDGGVAVGGQEYRQPMIGRHAPEVPGDTFTWVMPRDGKTAEWTFTAVSVEIIPDRIGEYDKLFVPLESGKPLLVTYQCHPAGSLAQRRVVRHEFTSVQWTDRTVEYV